MARIRQEFKNWFVCAKAPGIADYVLFFGLFLIPFITIMYGDTRAFVHYGVNFWKCITQGGGLHNFYEYGNDMLAERTRSFMTFRFISCLAYGGFRCGLYAVNLV